MDGYNFTERVRKILARSREAAARLHHEYVGTEHILLGLIADEEGVSAAVLQNLGVDLERTKTRIEASVKRGTQSRPRGDVPYTSRAKKVLELTMAEARSMMHSYVGTEHLLLGLIREEKGIAAQVLGEMGVTYDAARDEILRILGPEQPQPAPQFQSRAGATPDRFYAPAPRLRTDPIPLSPRVRRLIHLSFGYHPVAENVAIAVDKDSGELPGARVVRPPSPIAPEDVFTALLRSREGAAIAILEILGVDVAGLLDRLSAASGSAAERTGAADVLAHQAVDHALLALAQEEAELDGAPEVGTQHLLIAALRLPGTPSSEALNAVGVTLDRARAEVRRISG
jgi:ATP-dependent Clp protease ATP-binding subunit ClpA